MAASKFPVTRTISYHLLALVMPIGGFPFQPIEECHRGRILISQRVNFLCIFALYRKTTRIIFLINKVKVESSGPQDWIKKRPLRVDPAFTSLLNVEIWLVVCWWVMSNNSDKPATCPLALSFSCMHFVIYSNSTHLISISRFLSSRK